MSLPLILPFIYRFLQLITSQPTPIFKEGIARSGDSVSGGSRETGSLLYCEVGMMVGT